MHEKLILFSVDHITTVFKKEFALSITALTPSFRPQIHSDENLSSCITIPWQELLKIYYCNILQRQYPYISTQYKIAEQRQYHSSQYNQQGNNSTILRSTTSRTTTVSYFAVQPAGQLQYPTSPTSRTTTVPYLAVQPAGQLQYHTSQYNQQNNDSTVLPGTTRVPGYAVHPQEITTGYDHFYNSRTRIAKNIDRGKRKRGER
jgi:hypothetical protein